MRCEMCGKNTRCSCRGWWCPGCNSKNNQISLMNDLIKFWYSKEELKKNLKEIHKYTDKVDSFSLYEYLTGQMEEEKFQEALQQFSPKKKKPTPANKPDTIDTEWKVNPDSKHKFNSESAWARCIYCGWINRYIKNTECPKFIGNKNE